MKDVVTLYANSEEEAKAKAREALEFNGNSEIKIEAAKLIKKTSGFMDKYEVNVSYKPSEQRLVYKMK